MHSRLDYQTTIEEIEESADSLAEEASLAIDEARELVAERFGFVCWRHLIEFLLRGPQNAEHEENQAPVFLKQACLGYDIHDCPAKWEQAEQMLAENPSLADKDIWHASVVGAAAAVKEYLERDPALVSQRGGHFGWEPLMYACYSRLNLPERSTLEVAKVLLEHGADPDAHFMWGGQYRFTALTGAFGEGEAGPANAPEHPQCAALARLLLEAGADPNDSQALYNRMFGPRNECIELLLEFGLDGDSRSNWMVEDEEGELQPNSQQTLQYQLIWAIRNDHPKRARLLVDHGADLSTWTDTPPFYELAILSGDPELAEYLVEHGAERVELSDVAQLAGACMSGNEPLARQLVEADAGLMDRLHEKQKTLLSDAVSSNRLEAVKLFAELGADLDAERRVSLLHDAAWCGHADMAQLLISLGARPSVRDKAHNATPLQWALHNHQQDVADYLATQEIDLFDAVICGNQERIGAILDDDPSQLERTWGEVAGVDDAPQLTWKTPLATAVTRGNIEVVQLLLGRGANKDVAGPDGKELVDLAKEAGHEDIAELLGES